MLDERPSLQVVWPEVRARLHAFLRSRGVPSDAWGDISQEVALRALQHDVPFTDADDLMRWACTVAWRLFIGQVRRARATVDVEQLEMDTGSSTEDRALARSALDDTLRAIATLNDRDRRLIIDAIHARSGTAPDEYVARYRARRRLHSVLGQSSAYASGRS